MAPPFELKAPSYEKKVLLHCCCAPCTGSIAQRMVENGIEPTFYFYNPNIYPGEEYERRKKEVVRHARKQKLFFVDTDHEIDRWFDAVRGHEEDPERGERCRLCFEMRLAKTAAYAVEHGFKVFATTLGISRWKDLDEVNRAGKKSAARFPEITYWDINWRKGGGSEAMYRLAKEENFYRQNYCGCLFSLRQSLDKKHPAPN